MTLRVPKRTLRPPRRPGPTVAATSPARGLRSEAGSRRRLSSPVTGAGIGAGLRAYRRRNARDRAFGTPDAPSS